MTTKYFKAIYGFTTGTAITLDASSGNISATNANVTNQLISTVAVGTAPLVVTSTTRVSNLNVAYANVADIINVTAPGTGTGYIVFANATTGNVSEFTSAGISSNLANNSITATTFVGTLSGAAGSLTNALTIGTGLGGTSYNGSSGVTITNTGVTSIVAGTNISVSGANGAVTVNVSGTVANATFATTAGTVTNPTQGNITAVGTLGGLGVNGTITAVNITANTGVFAGSGANLTTLNASNISSGTLAQARLANSSLTVNGTAISLGGSGTVTATATNALTIGTGLGGTSYNGSSAVTITNTGVTSIVAGTNISVSGGTGAVTVNVSGTVANATYAVSAGSAGSATTAGTVTTAAQPNITSLGTLTRVIVGDGSASSPSMAFASDGAIDTGFYWGGDGFINWTNNGNFRGQFRPDGTAQIGTVLTTTLTTGASGTAGTIIGNWSLGSGSKLNATYADLAEKYTADADYEPGTVLVFGGEHEVTLSTETDSFRVAGVVTTNPAYTMNNDCEGEHVATIALQGRVPAKVIGPVFKGDLLVSTGNGYATANNIARAGTIIGKSLENFTGATGIIEVAVGRF